MISSDTAQVLKASFMVYMVPLLFLLAGLYIGQQLDGYWDMLPAWTSF